MNEVDVIALRKYIGLKQTEFSDKLGIAQSYLSEIERGLKPLTDEVYKKIVNAFESDLGGYLKLKSDNIANSNGVVNTGTIGGHSVNIQSGSFEKIIDKDRIEIMGGAASNMYMQENASLKAEIIRLEAIIKSKDETIAAKDETIAILRNR